MCQVIEAIKKTVDEDCQKQQKESRAMREAFFEGVTMADRPVDVDGGCAVSQPYHQPLDEVWGHIALAFSAADMYATPDDTLCSSQRR